jgi:hypothetical protein
MVLILEVSFFAFMMVAGVKFLANQTGNMEAVFTVLCPVVIVLLELCFILIIPSNKLLPQTMFVFAVASVLTYAVFLTTTITRRVVRR